MQISETGGEVCREEAGMKARNTRGLAGNQKDEVKTSDKVRIGKDVRGWGGGSGPSSSSLRTVWLCAPSRLVLEPLGALGFRGVRGRGVDRTDQTVGRSANVQG